MNKRTYEVNEAKGQFINYRQGKGCGGQKKKGMTSRRAREVLGTDEIVNSCARQKEKKTLPCKRAQQFFPLCSGIVE